MSNGRQKAIPLSDVGEVLIGYNIGEQADGRSQSRDDGKDGMNKSPRLLLHCEANRPQLILTPNNLRPIVLKQNFDKVPMAEFLNHCGLNVLRRDEH
jgi:hypothetical protein